MTSEEIENEINSDVEAILLDQKLSLNYRKNQIENIRLIAKIAYVQGKSKGIKEGMK